MKKLLRLLSKLAIWRTTYAIVVFDTPDGERFTVRKRCWPVLRYCSDDDEYTWGREEHVVKYCLFPSYEKAWQVMQRRIEADKPKKPPTRKLSNPRVMANIPPLPARKEDV